MDNNIILERNNRERLIKCVINFFPIIMFIVGGTFVSIAILPGNKFSFNIFIRIVLGASAGNIFGLLFYKIGKQIFDIYNGKIIKKDGFVVKYVIWSTATNLIFMGLVSVAISNLKFSSYVIASLIIGLIGGAVMGYVVAVYMIKEYEKYQNLNDYNEENIN